MSHVIVGTAGHIDHGKTALVRALTGIDTDTLPEEQSRGVTIDIGFAYWKENVTVIDVPGHERFVKNMVTGVCTVDLALFVVAADDGAMPQTREHLGILNLLGVQRGIVALTKVDLVEPDWVELVEEDLRELFEGTFLEGAPIVPVSSVTGEGIEALRGRLESDIARVEARPDRGVFRLPVDRVFSLRGFGTVATGTVLSGAVRSRDELVLLPSGKSVRVRGVQTHGRDVDVAEVGARAAVNLAGVEADEVARGDFLAQPGYFDATYMVDARLQLLPDAPSVLRNRARVHLHLGPGEVLARAVLLEADVLKPGESQLVQFRLEGPGVAARGDRFVVRRYSPVQTLGGGVVLDSQPEKHRRLRDGVVEAVRQLEQEDPVRVLEARLRVAGLRARSGQQLAAEMGLSAAGVLGHLERLTESGEAVVFRASGGECYLHTALWDSLLGGIRSALREYHAEQPMRLGLARDELRGRVAGGPPPEVFARGVEALLEEGALRANGSLLGLADHTVRLTPEQEALRGLIAEALEGGGLTPPDLQELAARSGRAVQLVQDVVATMQAAGDVVRVDESVVLLPRSLEEAEGKLLDYLRTHGQIGVAEFRDLVGTTRKYAVPLLNYFDNRGLTRRDGDFRVLVEGASA